MNSILHSHLFIKKFVTVFLLGVLTLAISPKKTLHNFLANHTDSISKSSDGEGQELSIAGFNCKCDDLVAESNFIATANNIIIIPFSFHSIFSDYFISFHSLSLFFFNLRGPPVKF